MSKKLRQYRLYFAPKIIGWLDESDNPIIKDEKSGNQLNPSNIEDKIIIYERQVNDWFLKPAQRFLRGENNGFIVLMICLSYFEGVEQYKQGTNSRNQSKAFFIQAIENIYHDRYSNYELEDLYKQARCGLFHNGMTDGKIIIGNDFPNAMDFSEHNAIKINLKILLKDIKENFNSYIKNLRNEENTEIRHKFNEMFSVLW